MATQDQAIKDIGTAFGTGPAGTLTPEQQAAFDKVRIAFADTNRVGTSSTDPTVTSDSVVSNEANLGTKIQNMSANLGVTTPADTTDALTKAFDDAQKILQDRADVLKTRRDQAVSDITRKYDTTIEGTKQAQKSETGATQSGLVRIGGYLGGSASAIGALNNLQLKQRTELASLEAEKQSAIQKAQAAYDDQDFALASKMSDNAMQLEDTINTRKKEYFNQIMQITEENRAQETFDMNKMFKYADAISPALVNDVQNMSDSDAYNYVTSIAQKTGIDADILFGNVQDIISQQQEATRKEVMSLSTKYPSAGIVESDSFESALQKVRGSREYNNDINKSELDIANARETLKQKRTDSAVDYSDPNLTLYSSVTGKIVTGPSEARAVIGYGESVLSGYEVVPDDFTGPLLENQITASQASEKVRSAFSSMKAATKTDEQIFQEIASKEKDGTWKSWTDEQKATWLKLQGKNPEDFGIYSY